MLYAISERLTSGACVPQLKGFTQLSLGPQGQRVKTRNIRFGDEQHYCSSCYRYSEVKSMPKKITRDKQERRELRVHASIQKARELVVDTGTPPTKAEVIHLGTTFRITLESFRPDLYGPPKTKDIDRILERGIAEGPEPESSELHVVKDTPCRSRR